MSRIDRRTFALGCLVLPLTGCDDQKSTPFAPSRNKTATQPLFLNAGYWAGSGPPVFVVTGPITR